MRLTATILLLFICMCGRSQDTVNTESELALKNKRYGTRHYKILQQYYTSQQLQTIRSIVVTRDGKIVASLRLPIADDEAKNFNIHKIAETANGFSLAADWGGGNYFYDNTYYFIYKDGQFYLSVIDWVLNTQQPEKAESHHKKLHPALSLSKVDMLRYLWKD